MVRPPEILCGYAAQGRGRTVHAHPCCAARWLDIYFSGREPDFLPLHPQGSAFRQAVWALLLQIPYGKTVTYGELSHQIAAQRGLAHMSAQAVGGAVGHNAISIIIPCHRVVGMNGSLTGYAGGIERKVQLLTLSWKGCLFRRREQR